MKKTVNHNGYMEIFGSVDLPADDQIDGCYWYVECPDHYRIFFEDLNEADDWVFRQKDTGLPPEKMDPRRLDREHGVYGYYVDLR